MTNVLIIDDHEVVRAGLILVLRSQFQPKLIKEAGNEKQSLGLIKDIIAVRDNSVTAIFLKGLQYKSIKNWSFMQSRVSPIKQFQFLGHYFLIMLHRVL